MYVGKYVRVSQEVQDPYEPGSWCPVSFEGWVLSETVSNLTFLDGDCSVLDVEGEVRLTTIKEVDTKTRAPWELHPERWLKTKDAWVLNVPSKVPLTKCGNCSLLDDALADDPSRYEPADVLYIAEAPGHTEVDQQRFMVGRSGSMFRSLIAQIMPEYTYTINNACMCFGETPDDSAIEACKDRLMNEITLVKPRLIVAVGAIALKALTGLDSIMEHQGMLLPNKIGNARILACIHPAAILRMPNLFPDIVNALTKASQYLKRADLVDVQPDSFRRYIATKDDFLELLERLASYPSLYCDTETTGFSPYKDKLICISMAGGDSTGVRLGVVFPWELIQDSYQLKQLLETREVGYYNGMFDCQFLRSNGIWAKIGDDVMLKHYTMDERPTAQSLKYVARQYCNAPDWERDIRRLAPKKTSSYGDIPKEFLYPYAVLDACYTGTLNVIMNRLMSDDNRSVYNNILLPAANMLLDVTRIGLKLDVARLDALRPEMQAEIDKLHTELVELAKEGYRRAINKHITQSTHDILVQRFNDLDYFNSGSVQQVRQILGDIFGYNGPTGRPVLEEKFSGELFVDKLLKFRTTRKILGTYVDGLLEDVDSNGRIHPSLRLTGTVTGRLAS